MMKRPGRKLANMLRDPSGAKDFIIADAKDADSRVRVTQPVALPAAAHRAGLGK